MKRFAEGKTYRINGIEACMITVSKRTTHYLTFTGDYSGRKLIDDYGDHGLFGLGENITVDIAPGIKCFCFAAKEVTA